MRRLEMNLETKDKGVNAEKMKCFERNLHEKGKGKKGTEIEMCRLELRLETKPKGENVEKMKCS